jgi:hypothetical protein
VPISFTQLYFAQKEGDEVDGPEVGKAYIGPDDIVRWVTHESTRGRFHCLWLDENSGIWHQGGSYKGQDFPTGETYPAPEPGERYTLMGSLGTKREMTAGDAEVEGRK